ncbi:MAG: hypothetical protein ABI689_06110 [Thermoanaerobaculia bacterium]
MNPGFRDSSRWCRVVLSAAALWAGPLAASPVRIHQINSQAGFAAGTLEGVRVDARGVLTLAAAVETVAEVSEPFAFAAVALPDGWAIGTGGEGRVLKVGRDGAVSVLFDAPESNVFALLADPDGTLFVGTSPSGKVYRVRPGKAGTSADATPYFDPHETYIWALARDAGGALWVATGSEGHLYRVDAAGKGELIYDGEDPHLRSLLAERDGDLLIGTAGQGLILRRSANGLLRTIYDSSLSEVVALAEAPAGTIFAAVLASEASLVDLAAQRPPPEATQSAAAAGDAASVTVTVTPEGEADTPAAGSRPPGARGPRSELIAISAAGLVEPVWSSPEETVFALAWMSGRLFIGTGGEGRLYSVEGALREATDAQSAPVPPLTVTLDHDFDQRQVVGVTADARGATGAAGASGLPVVLTTNAAALYRLTARAAASGTYTSAALDSGQLARYGVFRWSGESPDGTGVVLRFRTGSSATPDASWSPWSAAAQPVPSGNGWEVPIPAIGNGRFLQWQAELAGAGGKSPRLLAAEASYRQVNQRPRIDRFSALDPGQILVLANFNPSDQAYEPAGPNRDGIFTALQPATAGGDARTKQLWKRGQRTLRWRATDPNGDELRFTLAVRTEAASSDWLPVVDDLNDDHYGFDATVLPDGRYRFRLTASDREGNGEGEALTAEQESEPVVIDHSPPERGRAELADGVWRVAVTDRFNPLREAMLSIDAGEWRPVTAADGLLDGQRETLLLGAIPPSARLVLLRLADAALNYKTFDLSPEVK